MPERVNYDAAARNRWRVRRLLLIITILTVSGLVVYTAPQWMQYLGLSSNRIIEKLAPATALKGNIPAKMGSSWKEVDDPAKDGWNTEVFSAKAGKVLKIFGEVFSHSHQFQSEQFSPLLTEGFTCTPLLPAERNVTHNDDVFRVEYAKPASGATAAKRQNMFRGPEGLASALRSMLEAFKGAKDVRCKFKVYRVRQSGDAVITTQFVAISGRTSKGMVEQNATWIIQWQSDPKDLPKLEWIGVLEFEQVMCKFDRGPLFVDCTKSALQRNACYKRQFLRGMNYWLQRIQDTRYLNLYGSPGLAVGDVNGDGLEDLYVCQEEGLPNRLFLQQPDGSARDVTKEWGVDWLHASRSALLVDLDNDGDQDLVAATVGFLFVAANEGRRFTIRAVLPTDDDTMSLCATDYDGDGDLDIYVCVYLANAELTGKAQRTVLSGVASIQGRHNGGRNSLFRNENTRTKSWRFANVTEETGLNVDNRRHSYAAAWEDYDNDGDQDLYVANDFGRNNLYRNDDGKFTDVTSGAGALDNAFGMSVAWSDYDRDGWMDIYVSNMFSAAGNRVVDQDRVKRAEKTMVRRLQRFARGNTLLRNLGNGTFTDNTETADVAMGRWAWSSNFVDINNDGWDDLVVANGYLTAKDPGDL